MTAHTFLIVDLVTGRRLGGGVVCPEARYASLLRTSADRPDRRFVPVTAWLTIEKELQWLDNGPVDADSALSRALLGERRTHSLALQRLSQMPIEGEPAETGRKLDALLRSLLPPRLLMRQEKDR